MQQYLKKIYNHTKITGPRQVAWTKITWDMGCLGFEHGIGGKMNSFKVESYKDLGYPFIDSKTSRSSRSHVAKI